MKCETCGEIIRREDAIRGEICNNCSCEELHNENYVEPCSDEDLKTIAKGEIPKGMWRK